MLHVALPALDGRRLAGRAPVVETLYLQLAAFGARLHAPAASIACLLAQGPNCRLQTAAGLQSYL